MPQPRAQTLYDSLAANMRGEGTEDETKLQQDLIGAYFTSQGLITPAVTDFVGRVGVEYRDGVGRYNAFVSGVLPGINAALKSAGQKGLPAISTMTLR